MLKNLLHVRLREFRSAVKPFSAKRRELGTALLAYEAGFLSIESGELTVVMRADGHWEGRARFAPEILRALATVPPSQDPVTIGYADSHLLLAGMTMPCQWQETRITADGIPMGASIMELLVLEQTVRRVDAIGTSPLARKIGQARQIANRRISNAARSLKEFGVAEDEIRALVEKKIAAACERRAERKKS
ncbi:MAG: hypothetical protein LT102_12185 [Burkholderiaceae bacterium]|nr:hypothetical protein [Burkholderiaceae bacterium]